jgi:hypothetical protein
MERINRTRTAEGEAFLMDYDLAETSMPGAAFSKTRFRRILCGWRMLPSRRAG